MNLIDYLPGYYEGNSTMEELQKILSRQVEACLKGQEKTIDQCFVNTATSILSRYERIYGVEVDASKSNEFRREQIRAKMVGQGTATKQLIMDVAASFSGGEVEVIEDNRYYKFYIKFVGVKGIPSNMADLIVSIEQIKPAHLTYEFIFTYNTWGMIREKTWTDAGVLTWDELRRTE